jgi:hypothetical protein
LLITVGNLAPDKGRLGFIKRPVDFQLVFDQVGGGDRHAVSMIVRTILTAKQDNTAEKYSIGIENGSRISSR